LCSKLLRSGRRPDLLCSSHQLLQHGLLQEVTLLQAAQAVPAQDQVLPRQEEPLLQQLQQLRSDLRCSRRLRPDLRCPKLRRSSLLPLVCKTE
jgi:hypothetical protein